MSLLVNKNNHVPVCTRQWLLGLLDSTSSLSNLKNCLQLEQFRKGKENYSGQHEVPTGLEHSSMSRTQLGRGREGRRTLWGRSLEKSCFGSGFLSLIFGPGAKQTVLAYMSLLRNSLLTFFFPETKCCYFLSCSNFLLTHLFIFVLLGF